MIKIIVALGMLALCNLNAADEPVTSSPYEVVWDTPSADTNGTMPLGNGEIVLNAWIEPSGDLRDGVHFSGKGLREHGKCWADKVAPWLEKQTGKPTSRK